MTVIRTWIEGGDNPPNSRTEQAEILIYGGHTKYSWGVDPEGVEVTWYTFDQDELAEPESDRYKKAQDMRTLPKDIWEPFEEEFGDWGNFAVIKGPLYKIHMMFHQWAGAMMCSLDPSGYRPGGDDDYFDYFPSGMEGLRGFAIDLDHINGNESFYKDPGFLGVYDNVLLDFLVREYCGRERYHPDDWLWEHIPDNIAELARDYNMSPEACTEYIIRVGDALELRTRR